MENQTTNILRTQQGRGVSAYLRSIRENREIVTIPAGYPEYDIAAALSDDYGIVSYSPGGPSKCAMYRYGVAVDRNRYEAALAAMPPLIRQYGKRWTRIARAVYGRLWLDRSGAWTVSGKWTIDRSGGIRSYVDLDSTVRRGLVTAHRYCAAGSDGWLIRIVNAPAYHSTLRDVDEAIVTAQLAWAAEKPKILNDCPADQIWVDIASSSAAGNCDVGTAAFIQRHGLQGYGAIRGDWLLELAACDALGDHARRALDHGHRSTQK